MSAVVRDRFEVEDLDASAVLEAARANEEEIRRREFLKLRLAAQWAVLHPATAESGVETPGGPALDILLADESLGGDGTPLVAAFTPEAFAVAIGGTPSAAGQLIGDALDLRHRLPILWQRVEALTIPAWQARRVAQQTHRLPFAGARWVDEQLATRTGCGPVIVDRLVAQAIAMYDPETHEDREELAKASWDVNLTHPQATDFAGTSDLTARGDTLTLKEFYDLVCAIAHQLHLEGDTDPLGARKAKALGVIVALATGQPALGFPARSAGKAKVYVRIDADDLDIDHDGGPALATGEIEKLGAATLTKIRDWVGHHQVIVQPVLNMTRRDAVDQHDPPPWMRELVELRDGHCVFPRCTVHARSCDLDHTIPYHHNGPPGQTRPDNLAALCRRHHRAKTSGLWRYLRLPDGRYLWHGPHGATFLVSP